MKQNENYAKEGLDISHESETSDTDLTKTGVVIGCTSLAVRTKPDSNSSIAQVIKCGTEITIDTSEDNAEFYKVYTAFGVNGYCMKEFIEII